MYEHFKKYTLRPIDFIVVVFFLNKESICVID